MTEISKYYVSVTYLFVVLDVRLLAVTNQPTQSETE